MNAPLHLRCEFSSGGTSKRGKPDRRRSTSRTAQILRRLVGAYGRPKRRRGDGVDCLVGTILSQNTSGANSSAGFRRLKERFRTWDAAADARVSLIERCIRVSGLGRVKAPRIRRILREIRADRGGIDLQFLGKLNADDAFRYLLRFDGVGPKTALCVLLFALGMDVFPVDTHIYRITRRLGLLPDGTPENQAHEVLSPMIAAGNRFAMHVLLIAHGRAVCRARNPRCDECCLLPLCAHGRRRKKDV